MGTIAAVMANAENELELYRAIKSLSKAAELRKLQLKIEIQEEVMTYNKLTKEDIANSKIIIMTGDSPINDIERFKGMTIFRTVTKAIEEDAADILSRAADINNSNIQCLS
ncbi:PTS sugar transporter subunit IIB [Pectinatus sottacetonis]|uniref:hypothetical protein n=1 Tax=Pectinatus sottacetonis TaxID=1002795 RepID=UPI0018C791CB|nr:hypothetical protein [Pectinatus sottacetonis]